MFPKYAQTVRNVIVFCLFAFIPIISLLRYGNFNYLGYSLFLGLPFFIIYFLLAEETKPKIKTKLSNLVFNPLFVFFIFISLSGISVFYSISRYDSLLSFLSLVALGLIFIASIVFFTPERRIRIFLPVFLIFSLLLSLSGLGFYLFTHSTGSAGSLLASSGQISIIEINLPFLGGNFFTGFILISLPIAFWGLYKNDKIKKDIFYGLALAIFLAILSLETEKEVLVILGFILLLLFTFIFVFRPAKKFDLQKIASKTILVITVAYLLFYSIGVVKDKKIIVNRLQLISERTLRSNPDFFNKKNHWEGEIEIIKKYPFGTGLGTFDLIYPQYKKDVLSFDKNSYSYFLQAFTEVGILGFLAFLWFILILVWRGFKLLSFGSRKENFWVPVILVSIVGSVFYNLISSNFSFLPNLAVFLIFSGIILSGYNNLAKKDREVIYTIKNRMIFLILAFLLLILGVWQVYPNVNFDLGEEVEDYNFKEAKPKYEESIRFNPNPYYLAKLAEINYYLRGHDDNLNRAYKLAERSINLTPYNSLSYIVLGRLDVASGNTKRAVENFKKAIALDPLEEINGYIYLTDIYFKEGEYKEIEETLNLVLPKYSKEIIEKRIEMESLNLEVFHLKTRIAGLYNSLGLSLLYENQPVSAEESFKRAIELNPKNPNSRYYLGVALVKQGRVSEGEKEKSDVLEAFGDYKPPYEIK